MDWSGLTAGEPIPAVKPRDLRSVWALMEETRVESLGNPGTGISVSLLARQCSPEANVLAVWARSVWLGILVDQGLLTSWQHGSQLDDAVFDAAATFPMPGMDQIDSDAFLRQLRGG